jgi:hypothetical protein
MNSMNRWMFVTRRRGGGDVAPRRMRNSRMFLGNSSPPGPKTKSAMGFPPPHQARMRPGHEPGQCHRSGHAGRQVNASDAGPPRADHGELWGRPRTQRGQCTVRPRVVGWSTPVTTSVRPRSLHTSWRKRGGRTYGPCASRQPSSSAAQDDPVTRRPAWLVCISWCPRGDTLHTHTAERLTSGAQSARRGGCGSRCPHRPQSSTDALHKGPCPRSRAAAPS